MRAILSLVVPAVVVALALQIAWTLARAILEQLGVAKTNAHVVGLSFACLAASYLTIAAATAGLVRRVEGRRRLGAWIATIGFLALVASIALYEALIHSSADRSLALAVRVRGWSIVEAITILGLALAAGPRGLWLAPPAIGLSLLNAQPGLSSASWSPSILLGLLIAKAALLVWIAAAAERGAARCEPDPQRASAGMRRAELSAWLSATSAPLWSLAWLAAPTIYVAVGAAFTSVMIATLFAAAAWSLARAGAPESPRWAWYASAMLSVMALARTVRTWLLSLHRHWGDLEGAEAHLRPIHWSAAVPGFLAVVCALGALAVIAHRSRAHELTRAAVAAGLFSTSAFIVQLLLPEHSAARIVSDLAANLAAVHAYRVGRVAMSGTVPRAHIRRSSATPAG